MKVKGLRWWVIALICLATIINYIDRSALGIMWPSMKGDLGMTEEDYAVILNIFMVTYAAGKFISGSVFDKVGTRIGFTLSIFFWSLASLLHAFTRGILTLGIFRGILGVAEAGNWPGAVKSNAEWFPIKERAVAQGIFNAGAAMGSIIAPPIIYILHESSGWRWTFAIIGLLGFVWIIPWLIINKSTPNKHPWITDKEKDFILSGNSEEEKSVEEEEEKGLSLIEVLSFKEAWGVLASRFFIEPIWWLFVGWMPIYLMNTYKFNVKDIGLFAWFPYVGAAIGSISGGWYAKRLMQAGNTVTQTRKKVIAIGGSIMFLGLLATIFLADNPYKFVAIVFMVLFGFQFAISNIQTLSSDLLKGKSVGSLAGLAGTVGAVSVIIMNYLIPKITVESYTPAFILIAVLAPLAVLSIFVLIKEIKLLEKN